MCEHKGCGCPVCRQLGKPPCFEACYINSADIAADVAKAKAAGANILLEHMEVPNAGELAVIQDPQGAVFSLWKSSESAG